MTDKPRRPIVLFRSSDNEDTRAVSDILRHETTGGALMLAATVVALIWANFGTEIYEGLRSTYLGPMDIAHWASSGLLTIFFFVAGLELKRELTSGSLAKPAQALVPIVAAVCGMIVPALIYLAINSTAPGGDPRGWAIPMATDIAFAMAILAAVGSRLPNSLRAFLLTLAIVDDLGAIIVIAVVFTSDLNLLWLAGAGVCLLLWWLLQRKHITGWYLYVPLAIITWYCMYASGVHATIAGVALGLLSRSTPDDPHDPVDRWQHFWHPISAGFAVPIFALFSAGVLLPPELLADMVTRPMALGIAAGLIVGKVIGVFGGAYLTTRLTNASLAPDLRWSEVLAASVLAGVGFTVAIFISELTFAGEPVLVDEAKASVLFASATAAVVAAVFLRILVRRRARDGELTDD
ncbi:Na+/H+ antiporter NhaA [Naumannella huperziae]